MSDTFETYIAHQRSLVDAEREARKRYAEEQEQIRTQRVGNFQRMVVPLLRNAILWHRADDLYELELHTNELQFSSTVDIRAKAVAWRTARTSTLVMTLSEDQRVVVTIRAAHNRQQDTNTSVALNDVNQDWISGVVFQLVKVTLDAP